MSYGSDKILFTLSTFSLSHLSNLLASINTVGSKCLVTINDRGLFFSMNQLNICQVQLHIGDTFFDSFEFYPSEEDVTEDEADDDDEMSGTKIHNVQFVIEMLSLLESVTIANSYSAQPGNLGQNQQNQQNQQLLMKTNCILSYQGYGYPFVLSFEDELMLERVELKTFNLEQVDHWTRGGADDDDDLNDNGNDADGHFEIDYSRLSLEMTLNSSILFDILKDLREIQTEQVYIYGDTKGGRDKPRLIFISKGELGYSKLFYPSRRRLLEELKVYKPNGLETSIETTSDSITCFYNFNYFVKLIRLSRLLSKVKFKRDSNGLTSIIMLIKDPESSRGGNVTVEFKLLEQVNDFGNTTDEDTSTFTITDNNNNYNNSFIQNLIDDDDVIELPTNFQIDDQQRLDDLLGKENNNFRPIEIPMQVPPPVDNNEIFL